MCLCVRARVCWGACTDVGGRASRLCCVSHRRRALRSQGMMWAKAVRRTARWFRRPTATPHAESAPAATAGVHAITVPAWDIPLRGLCCAGWPFRDAQRTLAAPARRAAAMASSLHATRSLKRATEYILRNKERCGRTGNSNGGAARAEIMQQTVPQPSTDVAPRVRPPALGRCRGDVDRLGGGADQVRRHPAWSLPRVVWHLACWRAVCCASTAARCMSAL